jgi:8-oxo-dGTP diphosphatase
MINRPRVFVSVYAFNSEGTKILVGKKFDQNSWSVIGAKLEYGEEFEECAIRLIKNITNISIDDPNRLKFICTYNAVDKVNKNHMVAVDFYLQFTKEEEISYFKLDIFYYQKWGWYSFEDLLKIHDDLFCSIQIFLKKFNIQNFDDIKTLNSN